MLTSQAERSEHAVQNVFTQKIAHNFRTTVVYYDWSVSAVDYNWNSNWLLSNLFSGAYYLFKDINNNKNKNYYYDSILR
jgi:hypothetical protein